MPPIWRQNFFCRTDLRLARTVRSTFFKPLSTFIQPAPLINHSNINNFSSEKFSGMLGFQPWVAEWEASMLPLCFAHTHHTPMAPELWLECWMIESRWANIQLFKCWSIAVRANRKKMTNIGNLIKLVFTAIPVDVLIIQILQYHQFSRSYREGRAISGQLFKELQMTGQLKMRQLSTATVIWLQMITVSCFSPRRIESCFADKRTFKVVHSEQSRSTDAFLCRRLPAFGCPCVRLSVCPSVHLSEAQAMTWQLFSLAKVCWLIQSDFFCPHAGAWLQRWIDIWRCFLKC